MKSQIYVVMRAVNSIRPYERNPRINNKAVEYVKASIKEFGFKVPIVIDQQGVIVTGHTRLKAAKQLKLKEVPCIVADDLTPEQIKAFRLADNKVSEIAKWDESILQEELADLLDLNFAMEPFGFEFNLELPEDEPESVEEDKENARMNTMHQYNLEFYDPQRISGWMEFRSIPFQTLKTIRNSLWKPSCGQSTQIIE